MSSCFSREYRAHPIMILTHLKPVLFVLLIPVFKAAVQAAIHNKIDGLFLNEIILFAVIVLYAIIKWKKMSIKIMRGQFVINSGLVLTKSAVIDIDKISTVETIRTPWDFIWGSTTVRVNTEAGRIGKADHEFKLKKWDAAELLKIMNGSENKKTVKFSAIRVALMAAATSSSVTGIIVAVPVINQAGKLFGTAASEIIIKQINDVSMHLSRFIPPAINAVTIIFLASYTLSFLNSLLKSINFRVRFGDGRLEVSSGLIRRKKICFKTRAVNDVSIEQNPLMRLFGRYMINVEIGGYGNLRGEKAVLVPSAKRREVKTHFAIIFPDIYTESQPLHPDNKSRHRFFVIPVVLTAVIFTISALLYHNLTIFRDLILFLTFFAFFVMLYYFDLAVYNIKNSAISISDMIYAKYSRWTKTRELYCTAEKIGMIHIVKWPADKKRNTCNIRLTVRSEGSDSITVKHVAYQDLRRQIENVYKER